MVGAINVLLVRRDLAWLWKQNNPILERNEPGLETDTRRLRIGDGITKFMDLPFYEPFAG